MEEEADVSEDDLFMRKILVERSSQATAAIEEETVRRTSDQRSTVPSLLESREEPVTPTTNEPPPTRRRVQRLPDNSSRRVGSFAVGGPGISTTMRSASSEDDPAVFRDEEEEGHESLALLEVEAQLVQDVSDNDSISSSRRRRVEEQTRQQILDDLIIDAADAIAVDPAKERKRRRKRTFCLICLLIPIPVIGTGIALGVTSTNQPKDNNSQLNSNSTETLYKVVYASDAPSMSFSPSFLPSMQPSQAPSTSPSSSPSNLPSTTPSDFPSGWPSWYPSQVPTPSPSLHPSNAPTMPPSTFPSRLPTMVPSDAPITNYPSLLPTNSPNPSPLPTVSPTVTPNNNYCDQPLEIAPGDFIIDDLRSPPPNIFVNEGDAIGGNRLHSHFECKSGFLSSTVGRWYKLRGTGNKMTADSCVDSTLASAIQVYTDSVLPKCVNGVASRQACANGVDYSINFDQNCVRASWVTVPDTDYFILVNELDQMFGELGILTLKITEESQAQCRYAKRVSIGNTVATTSSPIEESVLACGSASEPQGPGLWYEFKEDLNDTVVTASTCLETAMDTQISVFQDNCNALQCVDGNDDLCGQQSSVTWKALAGLKYKVLVHGPSAGYFTLSFQVSAFNDVCETAWPLKPPPDSKTWTKVVLSLEESTIDPIERGAACYGIDNQIPRRGVWYEFNGTGRELQISDIYTSESELYERVALSIWQGSCDSLTCVEKRLSIAGSVMLEAGILYYLYFHVDDGSTATIPENLYFNYSLPQP